MPVKVLHVVQSLDPAWGGIARVISELTAGLTKLGTTCRIATLAGGRYGTPIRVDGVEVRTFAASEGSLGRSAEFNRAIGALVAETDVVHLHGLWQSQNWSAGKAARRAGKPYIMTPHSMMMPWAWGRSWWKKRPIGWLFEHGNLRHAARLHALAPGEADAMRALRFNDRIETIPNGVWPAEFENAPPPNEILAAHPHLAQKRWLLFLGRISPQKGIVPLMQACLDSASVKSDWHLVIAGPDYRGMRGMIEAAVRRKEMTDRVTFVGPLERNQVLQALARCEVLAQPSLSEGLSMSILEAMAAARPVVISPACNMPEVQKADAGRIVEPRRRNIAAGLRELTNLPDGSLGAMGDRARRLVVAQFNWETLLPRFVEMYAAVSRGK